MKKISFLLIVFVLITNIIYAEKTAGYLYTTLNGEKTNSVVSVEYYEDGQLGMQKAYSTKSRGGANRSAGGDAAGDFDSQGAVQIIGNYLLAVNAGGNTISVFSLNREDGELALKGNTVSEGIRPVSITYYPKAKSENDYWVVVGNQWNNPNAQKGGKGEGALELYPNADFHNQGHKEVVRDRNIQLFSFDAKSGDLNHVKLLDSYTGTNGGPATVSFNRNGKKLAVSTWGIAHFGTKNPTEQKPSRVYVYDFKNGEVSNRRHYEEAGVSGSIGLNWHPKFDTIYVSNFNLQSSKHNYGLTVLKDNGKAVSLSANFGTGNGDDIDEACWTLISPNAQNLYLASFGGNLISEFGLDRSGNVKKIGTGKETSFALRQKGTPAGDTKDMYITPQGKYMYVLGAYQTFTISRYDVSKKGSLTLKEEVKVQAATQKGAGVYNFLGLAGFSLK